MRVLLLALLLAACGSTAPGAADAGNPFAVCTQSQCLHGCIPSARPVEASDAGVFPRGELFCVENTFVETAWMDDRVLQLRAERKPPGGAVVEGPVVTGVTAAYTDSGTWPATGPGLELSPGSCYRTAARVQLASGHAAEWIHSDFTCF